MLNFKSLLIPVAILVLSSFSVGVMAGTYPTKKAHKIHRAQRIEVVQVTKVVRVVPVRAHRTYLRTGIFGLGVLPYYRPVYYTSYPYYYYPRVYRTYYVPGY
jgi:hypothetical protein